MCALLGSIVFTGDYKPMASVAVVWKGNCHDPRTRYRLLGHLHRLAARSDEYLRLRQPERPRVLDVMNQQRGGSLRARANVETVDQDISGKILVSSFVAPDPGAFIADARRAGTQPSSRTRAARIRP